MDLFSTDPNANLLPQDGVVHYQSAFLSPAESARYFASLRNEIPWRSDEVTMFGKTIVTARKVAWFGDAGLDYTYSGKTKSPLPWTDLLRELKRLTEEQTGQLFNSCLLNFYHDGSEGMGWHRDNESSIIPHSTIACVSLGAERRFHFKHTTTKERITMELASGSLLLMEGETQTQWLHALPKSKRVSEPRISLTFRQMKSS
ncbi:MAG: alpha-ketoglutarate-dependent dioxygenase AlkB [Akkermansiaceae bacterium]|jgi:alkylated DNA repair dioxygenase AlkB|tara:strand:+ start:3407 stop:4012 length:606 start_codon:yes stop_codon:yes gene_type:complete